MKLRWLRTCFGFLDTITPSNFEWPLSNSCSPTNGRSISNHTRGQRFFGRVARVIETLDAEETKTPAMHHEQLFVVLEECALDTFVDVTSALRVEDALHVLREIVDMAEKGWPKYAPRFGEHLEQLVEEAWSLKL
jgi:hypothetical protein